MCRNFAKGVARTVSLPFLSVFFLFPFLLFFSGSVFSVFFRFFRFICKKDGETPFARPLLRNPERVKSLCAFSLANNPVIMLVAIVVDEALDVENEVLIMSAGH